MYHNKIYYLSWQFQDPVITHSNTASLLRLSRSPIREVCLIVGHRFLAMPAVGIPWASTTTIKTNLLLIQVTHLIIYNNHEEIQQVIK
jgi:hypothetical protein